MRLTLPERSAIKEIVRQSDRDAKVFLYGSRTDDELRGGDIDLLILSERLGLAEKLDILDRLKERLGEQRIDVLIKSEENAASDPFAAEIMKSAVPL